MEIYSPGGMAEGLDIQDRDPLTVPSTRRNPVLADIFNRLGYMERKGSGFDKIISSYEFQVNFVEEKKPRFYSDRTQFRTIMPNLNYNDVPQNDTQGVGQDVGQDLASQIIEMITVDSKISKKKMAEKLNLSEKTIEREMKKMPLVRVEKADNFMIIELTLFPGRTKEQKSDAIKAITGMGGIQKG